MLRPIEPSESPPPPAYRVPWLVDRGDPTHPVVSNDSDEITEFLRAVIRSEHGDDAEFIGHLEPGRSFSLCLCETDLDTVTVTLCWYREGSDEEYVWPFVV